MDAKLAQINPKTSSHDWVSSLTSIFAIRIKNVIIFEYILASMLKEYLDVF